MPLYELSKHSLTALEQTSMTARAFREREDLQRHIRANISVLGDDLMVIAEEFSQWEDSRRRIDLLAIDRVGSLVVIELKRTEDGAHMELQAIRYAAMVSTLTFAQAVTALADLNQTDHSTAEQTILNFLDGQEPTESFGRSVRIVLVSPDFSKELTTSVLWLNGIGLDIRCIRLRPYALENRTLLEVDQIIPLREAAGYLVKMKQKELEAREAASESTVDFTRYDLTVRERVYPHLWKRGLIRQVIASAVLAGLTLDQLTAIIPARKFFVVDGDLSGEAFASAAQAARDASGYVFRPERFFMQDDQLIKIGDKTIAVSTQWGRQSLPLIDQIIALLPNAGISYAKSK